MDTSVKSTRDDEIEIVRKEIQHQLDLVARNEYIAIVSWDHGGYFLNILREVDGTRAPIPILRSDTMEGILEKFKGKYRNLVDRMARMKSITPEYISGSTCLWIDGGHATAMIPYPYTLLLLEEGGRESLVCLTREGLKELISKLIEML